jgi:hypothetical protein
MQTQTNWLKKRKNFSYKCVLEFNLKSFYPNAHPALIINFNKSNLVNLQITDRESLGAAAQYQPRRIGCFRISGDCLFISKYEV